MLLFGVSTVDITPPEPLPLGGYTDRRSANFEPGGDRLTARAIALGDIVIVSAEMLTMPESLVKLAGEKAGETQTLFLATHTHGAPDSQMLNDRMTLFIPGIAPYRPRWMEWYADRLAQAIREARAAQTQPVTEILIRKAQVPLSRGRRPFAAPDQRATRISVRLQGGAERVVLDIFSAHPTLVPSSDRRLRGDWPGQLMARTGGLAVTGAIGDMAPVPPLTLSAPGFEQAAEFARQLNRALASAPAKSFPPVISMLYAVPFPTGEARPHPEFAKANGITEDLAQRVVTQFAPTEASVYGLRFGNLALVGVPGEPTQAVAREIAALGRQRDLDVAVLSHANGWLGYILKPDDYNRGGYEARLALHGPGLFASLMTQTERMMDDLSYLPTDSEVQTRPLLDLVRLGR